MILWTIQPLHVVELLRNEGVYRCDPLKIPLPEFFSPAYDWLVGRMADKIGPPPEGCVYPVWAWYRWDGRHRKPDLRSERWYMGFEGDRFGCMEIEIPDDQVLLSDEELWHYVLTGWPIGYTEEETDRLDAEFKALASDEKKEFLSRNHERIFDVTYTDNDWIRYGKWVQATFWELRIEQVRKIQFFTSVRKRGEYSGREASVI